MHEPISGIKLKRVLILALLMIGAIFFRTYKLTVLLEWTGDAARDILIAKHHVSFFGQEPLVKPLAASSAGKIDNSPLYYLIVSAFYFLFSNPFGVAICFAVISSMAVVLAYAVGKQLINPTFGLLLALNVAFGNFFVALSRQIFQPNLLPVFTFLALYLFLTGQKHQNIHRLVGSIFVGFFMVHLHLSAFAFALVLPLMACAGLVKKKTRARDLSILIIVTVINLYFWAVMTVPTESQVSDKGNFVTSLFDNTSITTFLHQINTNFTLTQENLFNFELGRDNWRIFITHAVVLSTLWVIYHSKIRKRSSQLRSLLLLTVISIIVVSVHSNEVLPHHMHVYTTLYFIMLCCLIWQIKLRFIRWGIFLVFFYFSSRHIYYVVNATPKYDFESDYQISQLIYEDIQKNTEHKDRSIFKDINIYVSDNGECFDFFPHSYWYFLEEITQKKLVSLKVNNNNLFENPSAKIGYLVCLEEFYSLQECLTRFVPPYAIKERRLLGKVKTPQDVHKYVYRYSFDVSRPDERCLP